MHVDRRGLAQKAGEQVAACPQRVVDCDRLPGEQEREVEVLLDERLSAEALGELGGLGVACLRSGVARLATLSNREDPARDRCGKEDGDARKQPAQAAVGAADAFVSFSDASRLSATNPRSSSFSSRAWSVLQSSAAARRAPR